MIIIGDDIDGISVLKTKLARQFEMKNLVIFNIFQVLRQLTHPEVIFFFQSKYVADIFQRARVTDNKTVDTITKVNARYFSSDSLHFSYLTLYRTIIGSLIYLIIIHPDIAYVIHVVSQFAASPITIHYAHVLCILRYLLGIVFQSLLLSSTSSLELRAQFDVDHDSDPTDRKFVTCFCIFQVILLFLEKAINNLLFLNLQPEQNIML